MVDELEIQRLKKRLDKIETDLRQHGDLIHKLSIAGSALTSATMELCDLCKDAFTKMVGNDR